MQQQNGKQADQHNGQGSEASTFELLERSIAVGVRRQRFEIEGPQQQGGRQFLHAVHENQQGGGAKRRQQQGQMHARKARKGGFAQSASHGIQVWRQLFKARLERAERDSQEPQRVGQHNHKQASRQQQTAGDAEPGTQQCIGGVVERGKRQQQPQSQDRPGQRVAKAGEGYDGTHQRIARQASRIDEGQSHANGGDGGNAG